MIIVLISFLYRSHCSPVPGPGLEPLRNAQNVGIVCLLPHSRSILRYAPSLFYALFYDFAVGVKSFKDIERVACLISCFQVCLTVLLIFYIHCVGMLFIAIPGNTKLAFL